MKKERSAEIDEHLITCETKFSEKSDGDKYEVSEMRRRNDRGNLR